MKLIKVSTDLKMTTHEFPSGSYAEQNRFLMELIGNDCDIYEHVMPKRLYTELRMKDHPTKTPGQCVSMLVDEEGLLKENEPNLLGSYLYQVDRHGHPIMGNILFVGEKYGSDGLDLCGIEDSVFKELKRRLKHLIQTIKNLKEVQCK